MKKFLLLVFTIFFTLNFIYSQDRRTKFPLKFDKHLYTTWTINDNIPVTVFLESAFPKIVFDEKFIKNHIDKLDIELIEAPENMAIENWSSSNKTKVTYLIKDSISFNGKKIYVDGLVADISDRKRDIIFPIQCLDEPVELNISKKILTIGKPNKKELKKFHVYDIILDSTYMSPYINTFLIAYDKTKGESLVGKFLFDLGNPNALVLNRNMKEVTEFLRRADRMMIKNDGQSNFSPSLEVGALWPLYFNIGNIRVEENYIVTMKLKASYNFFVGVLGNRFFENFIIIFDKDKIYLKPNNKRVKINKTRYQINGVK